jgi:cyclopropane fatty-acyl-phospholipid synthase-like methyltransferase
MATKIPERFTWAVESLAVEPHEHLLEIGCGSGVAVSLICAQLATGKITAIDQSPKMIAAATQRNQSCIASGKAVFHTAALSDFAGEQFHKIFAVNVNVFWLKPAQEFRVIKNLLLPAGRLYLFYEPPSAGQIHEIADKVAFNLRENSFSIHETLFRPFGVCLIASLAGSV